MANSFNQRRKKYDFSNFLLNFDVVCWGFLAVILPICGGQFGRKIDEQLSEKQAKHMPNASLKLPPKNRKLQINQSGLDLNGVFV